MQAIILTNNGDESVNLQKFIDAQNSIYPDVLKELRAGDKKSHWMWFIFPQLKELGQHSPTARFCGLESVTDARAYLTHRYCNRTSKSL